MAKKSLLLVDADPRSLRVLEVSLRKAGYSVATCKDADGALETVELSQPDLILSDTRLPGMNGFQLVEELRRRTELNGVPFMFLSSDASVESKVRGLELGVEDYLTKPIYIKEIITRINLTLQRQEREGLARRTSVAKTRFTGSLGDMGLVDLLQTIDISRKSGVLELSNGNYHGTVSFRDGQLVDAELGRLVGESAIYRLLLWNEGEFEIDFRPVRVEQRIRASTQALLMEGMRRIDEWGRLLEQIPSLDNVFEVSEEELVERLAEIPDEINGILKHFDGKRSLIDVVDAVGEDDLETLTAVTKLYFEGIIFPTGRLAGAVSDDVSLDEQLVPGEPAEAPVAGHITGEQLVPRAPTEPPPGAPAEEDRGNADPAEADPAEADPAEADPAEADRAEDDGADDHHGEADRAEADRAIANASPAESGTDVPERAADVEPEPSDLAPVAVQDEDGTPAAHDTAHAAAPEAAEDQVTSDESAELAMEESASTAREEPEEHEVADAAATSEAPPPPHTEQTHADGNRSPRERPKQEDAMARKGRRRRRRGGKSQDTEMVAQETQAAAKSEEATNVIRFPAQARAAVGSDVVVETADDTASAEPSESERAREDDTQTSVKREARAAEPTEDSAPEPKAEAVEAKTDETDETEAKPRVEEKVEEPEARESDAPAAAGASEEREGRRSRRDKKRSKREEERDSSPHRDQPKVVIADDAVAAAEPAADARRKKTTTTSSAEIRAFTQTGDHGEHAQAAADFFRSSKEPKKVEHETWDDLQRDALPVAPGVKQAKYATIGILVGGLGLIGAFLVYNNYIMPTPVETLSHGQAELGDFANVSGTGEDDGTAEGATTTVAVADSEEGTTEEGATEAGATEEGATEEGTTEEGATEEGVTEEGATEEGATEEGATEEGATEEGATEEGTTEPVAVAEPTPPPAPTGGDPEEANRLSRQALSALNRRQNEQARDLASQAVAADPTNAMGWLVLGAARAELGDADGAHAAYQSCVDQGSNRVTVRDCRAMLR
ncbi:MAG: DUF4388 domain-containing protein [Sandaracinaceae bacterium]